MLLGEICDVSILVYIRRPPGGAPMLYSSEDSLSDESPDEEEFEY